MNGFDFILKMTRAAKPMKAVAAVTQQIVMFFYFEEFKEISLVINISNKSVFSYLRTLETWHCPYSPVARRY